MTKGRRFAPLQDNVGIWFQHRGLSTNIESRNTGTTTGLMLNDPYSNLSQRLSVARCPPRFLERANTIHYDSNPFSLHDNRNSFQGHGVYFGTGLGKKKATEKISQHKSKDLITWDGQNTNEVASDINSLYREDYNYAGSSTPPRHRRYKKVYQQPKEGLIKLTSDTTLWVPKNELVPRTYLQTLANSQQPYLPENPWSYSYHSHSFARRRHKRNKSGLHRPVGTLA